MTETSTKQPRHQFKVSCLTGTLVILLAIVFLFVFFGPMCVHPPHHRFRSTACMANLRQLGLAMIVYAEEHGGRYPPAQRWCDLLADGHVDEKAFRCPGAEAGPCNYAMNPHADPCCAADVVLLFESNPGWNQFGGHELLTTENHKGQRCSVFFVDGSVVSVKADEIVGLKWVDDEDLPEDVRNARRPADDEELKYWLGNMVWHHRFTTEEVRAATGLSEKEIVAAQGRFDVWPGNRPERDADASLLVLPYPGGRHPRIGLLEGAIDPQRETKFSVFTPWDPNSYAVLDIPEALWSNLGLTYLAHTHIDTIWTKQGVESKELEWNRRPDGSLDIERILPNGLAFGVKVRPARDAVHMEMWLRNGTPQKLTDLRVQNCVMPKMAKGFAALTNDNKVLTNPYVACRSDDGKRWIITAWEGCHRPWANPDCPCFHSDPKFPDAEPGQTHRLRGWLSFYEGDDIQAEFKRIEATGWRQN